MKSGYGAYLLEILAQGVTASRVESLGRRTFAAAQELVRDEQLPHRGVSFCIPSNARRRAARRSRRAGDGSIFYLLHDIARRRRRLHRRTSSRELRPFADHIFVVVNGKLDRRGAPARSRRSPTRSGSARTSASTSGATRPHSSTSAQTRLAEFDELILMNYTWFGPVRSFAPVFERMEQKHARLLGHDRLRRGDARTRTRGTGDDAPSPAVALDRGATVDVHSRRRGVSTGATMPMITTYTESILNHESRFTHHFEQLGFTGEAAYPRRRLLHRASRAPRTPTC